jgi:hypothetical protein
MINDRQDSTNGTNKRSTKQFKKFDSHKLGEPSHVSPNMNPFKDNMTTSPALMPINNIGSLVNG